MILYVVISNANKQVHGPWDNEQSALDWLKTYNLTGLGWIVRPILPIP